MAGSGRQARLQRLLQEAEILMRNGSLDEGLRRYREIVRLQPDADGHYNLGVALQQLGRHEAAADSLRASLRLQPDAADAWVHLGISQHHLGRHSDALASYERAAALAPDLAAAHNNAGNALQAMGRAPEALECYGRALALNPRDGLAWNNRGNALKSLGRHDEALECYRQALEIDPFDADAHHLLALTLLCQGKYAQAWPEYEWRWKARDAHVIARAREEPVWHGEVPLHGKSILLQAEQGMGDTVQFSRYAALLVERGAVVHLDVPAPLVPLLRNMPGLAGVYGPADRPPPTDFRCPLLSLPFALGTTLENIPPPAAGVFPPSREVAEWKARLDGNGALLVGLCWRGNPGYVNDAQRSLALSSLQPLLTVEGVRFVSLQRELLDEEAPIARRFALLHPAGDFPATAALIGALDLVIAVDTVWLHWAGAIGTPAWALLSFAPHWAWLLGRADSPWYPSVRLLRQTQTGDWLGPIERAAGDLAAVAAGRRGQA